MRFTFPASSRVGKTGAAPRPGGLLRNTIVCPVAISTAGELRARPVGYAVELVRKAKEQWRTLWCYAEGRESRWGGTGSWSPTLVRSGSPISTTAGVSAGVRACGEGVRHDYLPRAGDEPKGEDGVVVPMCLPGPAMDRFVEEMGKLVRLPVDVAAAKQPPGVIAAKCPRSEPNSRSLNDYI
ncbi:hypothetical protein EJB05_53048, partial [Eragrostis curvula]